MPSMAGNSLERRGGEEDGRGGGKEEPCGEEDTRNALIITLFCCSAGKIKICGEENLVLQEHVHLHCNLII